MRQASASLTSVARRLTAERGINGFTVEEVCDEVGISRRTFFNYFPSKEEAIIGSNSEEDLQRFTALFLARGASEWQRVIYDLVDLAVEHFELAGFDTAEHTELMAALEREPKLLLRFMGISRARDRQGIALVAQRQAVAADDARAEASFNLFSTLLKSAGEQYMRPDNEHDFSSLLHERLAAMRAVLAPESPRKAIM